MTARTLPPLPALAEMVAEALGGSARMLDSGAYPSAAIALGDRHPLLVRDHHHVVSLSLPLEGSWSVRTPKDWQRALPSLRRALALGGFPCSMSDVALAFADSLVRLFGGAWELRFPGTPVPQEAWLKRDHGSVGLFQSRSGVRVVVWVGGAVQQRSVTSPSEAAALAPFLETQLAAQHAFELQARDEQRRRDALPLPDFEAVLALLRAGARISTGGGRWYQTFFWDGQLRVDVVDEGFSSTSNASDDELRSAIRHHPDRFRDALASRNA